MKAKPIYNLRTKKQYGVAIVGDYSGTAVYLLLDQLEDEFGGDIEEAFHQIKKLQNERLLPRMGSAAKPLSERDFELCHRNAELGKRHWQWVQEQGLDVMESTGCDSVWGYGYYTDNGFVIVDSNDNPFFVVEYKR